MLTTYNVRVLHEATPTLAGLIADRHLCPCPGETVQGLSGTVYRPAPTLLDRGTVAALSDLEFQLGPGILAASVYTLPPEEYAGLLLGSPGFRQYDVGGLIAPLTHAMDLAEQRDWQRALASALLREARSDSTPALLPHPPARPATWLPDGTRLIHGQAGWFLCLRFDVPAQPPRLRINRSAAGIDLGLRTLAVAAYKSGLIHKAGGITEIRTDAAALSEPLARRPDLWSKARLMSVVVQHAAARGELAQFMDVVLAAATVVGYEKLTYKDMDEPVKRRFRALGLRDFLAVWLPQRLRQHGLTGQSVTPHLTSRLCNRTYLGGVRDQGQLRVTHGAAEVVLDADENAASNIRDLALAHLIQYKGQRTFTD
ncbi:hypothetical protein [Deinococcus sedimenti]|uniref:Transposase n=1 Tax=Deinococcus sedimenti TaxID=1867090 RepID=A0ABQ2SBP5_9DEIO|nr:hypothetical protein [Deinococcus sedimenti]GGS05674.1 hypothetical protein GCM10008960_35210 [Deinococcus sedimenti]